MEDILREFMCSHLYSTWNVVIVTRVFWTHAVVSEVVLGEFELGHRNAVEAVRA